MPYGLVGVDENNPSMYTSIGAFGGGGSYSPGMTMIPSTPLGAYTPPPGTVAASSALVPSIESLSFTPTGLEASGEGSRISAGAPQIDAAADPSKAGGGFFRDANGNFSMGNLGTAFDILKSIAGIYGAYKYYSLAKDQFNLQKTAFETNLKNSTKSYNTALEDRTRARAAYHGWSEDKINDTVNKHKL